MKEPKIINHYLMIAKCDIWIEDFIDEDTGEVVSITRKTPKSYFLTIISIPQIKSTKTIKYKTKLAIKQATNEAIDKILNIKFKNCKVVANLTPNKYYNMKNGKIKKYLPLKLKEKL